MPRVPGDGERTLQPKFRELLECVLLEQELKLNTRTTKKWSSTAVYPMADGIFRLNLRKFQNSMNYTGSSGHLDQPSGGGVCNGRVTISEIR
ncbi:hypothetical protein AB6A40_011123 [Gnathostoma spinigerum]|uniref:Uncharacterized protein n=1 Tax=Gnathostoma spinigerum TaxID=75299 RepID=A0ABD6F166_9BILA